jgi:prepilin-type N-terminal cleavage/methylation domain-containing protein
MHVASEEHGFTLVELIVVMVLVGMVFAAIGHFLIDTSSFTHKAASTRSAARMADETLDRLGNDVRSAMSPDRDVATNGGLDALRRFALYGVNPPGGEDMRDIVLATPRELWFRSNVIPEGLGDSPVSECVGYVFGSDRTFKRVVYANWRTCPSSGTPVEQQNLFPQIPAEEDPANTADPNDTYFSYRLAANGNPSRVPLRPFECQYSTVTTPTSLQTNQIVGVNINLRAIFGNTGSSAGEAKARGAFDLRMRLNRDYQWALGCAY